MLVISSGQAIVSLILLVSPSALQHCAPHTAGL